MAMGRSFRLYHKVVQGSPYSVLLEQRSKDETLLFESGAVALLSAGEVSVVKKQYVRVQDAYGCLGVLQLNAGKHSILYLVLITGCISVGKVGESDIFRITNTLFVSLQNQPNDEERIVEVRKLINSGTFYFSWSSTLKEPFDLTLCAQRQPKSTETDNRFFWNRMLFTHLLRYEVDCSQWLLKTMCGSVEIRTLYIGQFQAKACIISRLSCERAGTRFNVRGCNDDGHVANFVETEQVIYIGDAISSYLQTRGSVPLFWEQPGVQVGSHKVKMSRGSETSAKAFDRHLKLIKIRYGKQAIVNLLGCKEGESLLSHMFQSHLEASHHSQDVPYIHFDYHALCKRGRADSLLTLHGKVAKYLNEFGLYCFKDSTVVCEQSGTVRTNCLDCLDRTNCVQTYFGFEMLSKQLQVLGVCDKSHIMKFEEAYRQMWVTNGDQISKIYAGTGALEGKSKLMDGARSVGRTIQNNLLDNSKQEAIDMLLIGSTLSDEFLGRARVLLPQHILHAPPSVLFALCNRHQDFTVPVKLRFAICSWNVNGGRNLYNVAFKNQPLTDWLLDASKLSRKSALVNVDEEDDNTPPDIFAIGFEEIVDLNASNIMAASTTNQKEWDKAIRKAINRDHRYVVVTTVQLVGVCLFVFVKQELVKYVRDVAVDSVKTGLGGATGNKGGVAIRMLVHSTSLCFICAHFAAGQSQVNERNSDFFEISRRLTFPMGQTVDSHDYVFWCGDFNYRITLPIEEVKDAVKQGNFQPLWKFDQLNVEREAGKCFPGFQEGELNFAPTYKYDTFSDDYDTSEKCRIPAWTDRILWRRRRLGSVQDPNFSHGKLVHYVRSELKTSDHRPVIANLDIDVLMIDEHKRSEVFHDVLGSIGPPNGTVLVTVEQHNDASVFTDQFIEHLLKLFEKAGEVILVRFVEEAVWIIFRNGRQALNALEFNHYQVDDETITITLKSDNWKDVVLRELQLCSDNTIPLINIYNDISLNDSEDLGNSHQPLEDELESCSAWYDDESNNDIHNPSSGKTSPVPSMSDITPSIPPFPSITTNKPKPQRPPPLPQFAVVNDKPAVTQKDEPKIPVRPAPVPPPVQQLSECESSSENGFRSSSPPPPTMAPPPLPPITALTSQSDLNDIKQKTEAELQTSMVPPPVPPRTNLPCPPVPARNLPPAIPPRGTL
ncbi:hypothetical protein CHUAL_007588 [Chamberlinius hualienensis]